MKPDKIHDALNHIDDDLIEAADKLRQSPRYIRPKYTHTLAAVACALVALTVTLLFARFISLDVDNGSSDGVNNNEHDGVDEIVTDTGDGSKKDGVDGTPAPQKGSDILVDGINLVNSYSSVKMRLNGAQFFNMEPIDEQYFDELNDYLELAYDADVVSRAKIQNLLIAATLEFELEDATKITVYVYEEGYIAVETDEYRALSIKAGTGSLTDTAFKEFLEWLESVSFDYEEFYQHIPTSGNGTYMFPHKIFPGNIAMYLYSDAYEQPEELVGTPTRYDKRALLVYYTSDFGDTISTLTLKLPEDFDASFDHIIPVYAGGGGGSGECEIIYRVEYGTEKYYIAFDNFSYTHDLFDFEYRGSVSDARMKELRKNFTNQVHVYDLLTDILPRDAKVGIYKKVGDTGNLVAEIDFFNTYYTPLLKTLGVTQGRNYSYAYPDSLTYKNLTKEETVSPRDTYFVHTNEGDLILTPDEAVKILTDIGFTFVDPMPQTDADLLYGVLGIGEGYSSVSLKYLRGDGTPPRLYHEVIYSLIEEIPTSTVAVPSEAQLNGKYGIAVINVTKDDGSEFGIHLYDGAYILILWDSGSAWIKLDEAVFEDYLSQLGYTEFYPRGFGERIQTPISERFAFYHKIYPTSVYLFFHTDAHFWTEANAPDKSSIKAYCYDVNNPDKGIGTVTFPLPEDFDLSYDSVTPVYANGGGDRSKCSAVFRLDYASESVFVEFNNFAYTNDMLVFEYAELLEEEYVKQALVDAISKLEPETHHNGGQK